MADVVVCAACGRARVKKVLVCPHCNSTIAYETERPKTKWYWMGAAIYYPCFAIILLAFLYWFANIPQSLFW